MDLKKNNEIQTYINDVCAQVKNKRMHKEIIAELNAHLEEKANEYLKGGKSENEALKEAINEMGSSKHVGDELNEIHKCNTEWSVLALSITLVLLSIGFMSLFQMNGEFYRMYGGDSLIRDRTILWGAIGVSVLLIACFIDYRKIKKYSKYIYIVGIVLLSFTVITCVNVNGFRQRLSIGGSFSINMGYFGPILFIVALAGMYDKYDWNNKKNIIKGLLLGIIPLVLVAIANTNILGYFVVYGVTLILLVYMSKANKKILGLFVTIEILILFLTRVGFESISGFINRWNDINDSGYVYNQLKIMRDSSVLIGRGVNFDLNTLPEFYNDVIFSSIVYSFGWVAGAIIVMLIATFLIRIIKVAISVKNSYGKSLVLGITTILGIQFVWNILFNLGLAVGGVSLPFISYSGTSIIINMFIVGIIINIYKGRSISKVDLISLQHMYEIQKTKKSAQLTKKNNFTFELENMMDSMITTGAFLTSGNKHKANTMTISWGSVGYMWRKPIFIAIVSNIRYTKEFLDQGKNFTISIPYDKDKEKALQFCGHNSGRTVNKETYADIRFIQSKVVESPIVEGCNRYYECKVVFMQETNLEKVDRETIYKEGEAEHTMYFGEIVAQY